MGHVVPHIIANKSYKEAMAEEYDVLWVPAGPPPNRETGKDEVPLEEIEFVRAKAGKAKYVASVCGGAAVLARAGVLTGKRATTNKAFFTAIQKMTESCNVEWVPKARYVIDGNIWTSSGVTAGEDMALAFIEHLVGKEWADDIRNVAEVRRAERDDDPFAEVFGLV
ncbi:putative ThiJ/DJ-1 [Atractiella rhizophila]|nr:putative ThiJ/DJ-1 [Atractiella rhizophila]